MVGGLERFRDYFKAHRHQYALIGGSACDLLMDEAGLEFRATKDLDIVLLLEALNADFGRTFWGFIREGRYAVAQTSEGKRTHYRFISPQTPGFPAMLEILSRRPEFLSSGEDVHLTPLPFDDDLSSLSAILLLDEYYAFLKAGIREVSGVPVVGAEHLVPMKARAWLDLRDRRAAGHKIHSVDITKHRKDVFRLYRIMDPTPLPGVPPSIRADMEKFLQESKQEPIDLKSIGMVRISFEEAVLQLERIYGIG